MQQIQEFFSGTIGTTLLNLLAAVLILIIGYIVARLIAGVIRRLLLRTELDNRLADALSEPDEPRAYNVEDVIAKVVFWVLMLFVLVAFFQRLGLAGLAMPLTGFLENLTTEWLPRLLAAGLLLIVAWVVATILRIFVRKGAEWLKLDERLNKYGASRRTRSGTGIHWRIAGHCHLLVRFSTLPPLRTGCAGHYGHRRTDSERLQRDLRLHSESAGGRRHLLDRLVHCPHRAPDRDQPAEGNRH